MNFFNTTATTTGDDNDNNNDNGDSFMYRAPVDIGLVGSL